MSILSGGLDMVKASKEWKDEYEKKHDTALYIFRITDLNNKLCEENAELRRRIEELENPDFVLHDEHIEILKYIYENGEEISDAQASEITTTLQSDLAFQELEDENFIAYLGNTGTYMLCESRRAESLRAIIYCTQ